jgi:hypothetical protein
MKAKLMVRAVVTFQKQPFVNFTKTGCVSIRCNIRRVNAGDIKFAHENLFCVCVATLAPVKEPSKGHGGGVKETGFDKRPPAATNLLILGLFSRELFMSAILSFPAAAGRVSDRNDQPPRLSAAEKSVLNTFDAALKAYKGAYHPFWQVQIAAHRMAMRRQRLLPRLLDGVRRFFGNSPEP